MPEIERLKKQLSELENQWDHLNNLISTMKINKDRETRPEEKIRLEGIIEEKEKDCKKLEYEIDLLEKDIKNQSGDYQAQEALKKAFDRERNGATEIAIRILEDAMNSGFSLPEMDKELERLKNKFLMQKEFEEVMKQIGFPKYLMEIKTIYTKVIKRLKRGTENNIGDISFLHLAQNFVNGDLTAEEFIRMWEEQETNQEVVSLQQQSKKIELFYSYSHEDEKLRDELDKHLSQMKRDGVTVFFLFYV